MFPASLIPFITRCTLVTLIPGRYLWVSLNKAAYTVVAYKLTLNMSHCRSWEAVRRTFSLTLTVGSTYAPILNMSIKCLAKSLAPMILH